MNLTDDSSEHEHNSSSEDDDDDDRSIAENYSSLGKVFSDHDPFDTTDDDDDDDDLSDIENHPTSQNHAPKQNRLCTILRQSSRLVELKLNLLGNRLAGASSSLRHAISDSDMSKDVPASIVSTRLRRLYLPTSAMAELQTHITHWLQASVALIDSLSSSSTYHRRCWSQLLLTYFIERRLVNLEFLRCTEALSLTNVDHEPCVTHRHACVPEEDASKLCSILQKGSRLNINSIVLDHIRRIIVIKSMQEGVCVFETCIGREGRFSLVAIHDSASLQELYVKQLTSLKQTLIQQQQSSMRHASHSSATSSIASVYSKLLLFLSSLYSIKAETMQTLFCQHLRHNPIYSYLITS